MKNITILFLLAISLFGVNACKKSETVAGNWSASVGTTLSNGAKQSGNTITGEYYSSTNQIAINLHPSASVSVPTIGFVTSGANPIAFTQGSSYPLDGSGALTAVYTDANGDMYQSTTGSLTFTTLKAGSNNTGTISCTFNFHGNNYGGSAGDTVVVTGGTFTTSQFPFY